MPLFIPLFGVALWIGSALSGAGKSAADTITGTPQAAQPALPSWVIPSVVIGVGALLLYKEGAKILKL
jgi:hypothetical protein